MVFATVKAPYLIPKMQFLSSKLISIVKPSISRRNHLSLNVLEPFHFKCVFLDFTSIPPPRRMSLIVWMDLEMTGLNVRSDRIMEVICVITDNLLNVVAEGPRLVIHQSDDTLNNMVDWCKTTHTKVYLYSFT